ncbi:hypothetical protein [Rubrivirga sp. IMCC45206]|uniref:hypothetical protein n=1 Tax=Rubrivirga sp. IMCC45206 TaxID=3391614 RepID=UPI00398FFE68
MSYRSFGGSRLLSLAFLATLAVGSAPTADAQLGRLLNRATETVSNAGDRATEAAADRPPARADGAPAPAIDYASLLATRFFPAQGTFDLGDVFLVFPPSPEGDRALFLVRDAAGEVVSRQALAWTPSSTGDAFVLLQSRGIGDRERPVQAGRHTLDVEVTGDLVGSVPFTVTESSNGDPFNPVTTLTLDGPWRTHAYFSHETDRPDYILEFKTWIRPDEMLPADGVDYEPVEVSIRRDGREIAWGFDTVYATNYAEWHAVSFQLFTPDSRDQRSGRFADRGPRVTNWTIQDVTPGPYEVVISTEDGTALRTFTIEGGRGAFVPHARSAIDYEPRAHFLTTRRMGGNRNRTLRTLHWIAPVE